MRKERLETWKLTEHIKGKMGRGKQRRMYLTNLAEQCLGGIDKRKTYSYTGWEVVKIQDCPHL